MNTNILSECVMVVPYRLCINFTITNKHVPFSGVAPKQSIQFHSFVTVMSSNSFNRMLTCQVYGTKCRMSGRNLLDQSSIRSADSDNVTFYLIQSNPEIFTVTST